MLCLLVVSCRPDLPTPTPQSEEESQGLAFRLEPQAEIGAVPIAMRVHLHGDLVAGIEAESVVFARGELTSNNLADLAIGLPSDALLERMLPASVFALEDELVVVPIELLEPLTTYSVGIGSEAVSFTFRTDTGQSPILLRDWPVGPASPHLFFCGAEELGAIDEQVSLSPAKIEGRFVRGTPGGLAQRCVRFEPSAVGEGRVAHPPVELSTHELLEPRPIEPVTDIAPTAARECVGSERRLGLGCATIEDDRVALHGPDDPVLWVVRTSETDEDLVAVTSAAQPLFYVHGLTPRHMVAIEVENLDASGSWVSAASTVQMGAPRARPILSEVYANPNGVEPDQEWVEIYNDGLAPTELTGLVLEDVGGVTELPSATIEPGGFALIVNEAFDELASYDVPPHEGALLVRVPKLGKNGLSNSGEPLRLIDARGQLRSGFPMQPKPKAGRSVVRTSPHALDDAPDAFIVADEPTPGW